MPQYTLVVTGEDGHQKATVAEFIEESAAIEAAGRAVCAERPVVAVTRGAGAEAILLGAWEFESGDAYWWSED